jgi:cell division protein FtsZ
MSAGGAALMSVGRGSGEERARVAAQNAVSSRLLDVTIDGAQGVLFNITGGPTLSLFEVNQAAAIIRETVHPDANVIFGAVIDETMGDEIRITVIATGFDRAQARRQLMTRNEPVPFEAPKREPQRAPTPPPQQPAVEEMEQAAVSPRFSPTNLDIPAFLRRK